MSSGFARFCFVFIVFQMRLNRAILKNPTVNCGVLQGHREIELLQRAESGRYNECRLFHKFNDMA